MSSTIESVLRNEARTSAATVEGSLVRESSLDRTVRPLKVALIIDDLVIGGAQRGLCEEVRELVARGHECHVLVLAEQHGLTLSSDVVNAGARLHRVLGAGLRDVGRLGRLISAIRRIRPNVVHTYLEYANILGVVAARLTGRPVLASMRSSITQQSKSDTSKRLLQSLVLRWGADRVLVVAATARVQSQDNMGLPRDRVVVLPNAVDLKRLELSADFDARAKRREAGVEEGQLLVTTAARIDPVKGHRFLVSAIHRLRDAFPQARYLFVGTGSFGARDERARVRDQARSLGVADQIVFMEERADVTEFVAASDLFVLPSLAEGLSRALLEAMALGTPVVATAVGGNADVLRGGTTGWSIPPADESALAHAIGDALGSPEKRREVASRAKRLVSEEFAIGPHVARLERIYRETLRS